MQIAVFNFASRGEWYATQNMCPHKKAFVLSRGILGDAAGAPKVACPLHKKTFSLETGESLQGEEYHIRTFPVQSRRGRCLSRPAADRSARQQLATEIGCHLATSCRTSRRGLLAEAAVPLMLAAACPVIEPIRRVTGSCEMRCFDCCSDEQQLDGGRRFARAITSTATFRHRPGTTRGCCPRRRRVRASSTAFEVDLDRCSGCKACVTACHSLNGLDDGETWRDVGLLVGGTTGNPVMQHVTTACHHCLEPACLTACPVNAYEKDPLTGIVQHLDDQCFGCQYCTLACPYDVPKYHAPRASSASATCAPRGWRSAKLRRACRPARTRRSRIRVVDVQQVRDDAEADPFLPGRARAASHAIRRRPTRRAASFRAICCRPTITRLHRSIRTGR